MATKPVELIKTQRELAAYVNLTAQRMGTLFKEPSFPPMSIIPGRRGQPSGVNIQDFIKWWSNRAVEAALREHGVEGGSSLDSAKLRLEKARADKIEMENKITEKEYVRIGAVMDVFNAAAVTLAAALDALPGRMSYELAGTENPAEVRALLFDECRRIRQTFAADLERESVVKRSGADLRKNN